MKAVLPPARLGMAGSHVAAGLGEDRHDVGGKAHRPLGRHERGGEGRGSDRSERNDRQHGGEEPAPGPGGRRGKAGPRRLPGKGWGHASRVPSVRCHGVFQDRGAGLPRECKSPMCQTIPAEILSFSRGRVHLERTPIYPSTVGIKIVEFAIRKVRCLPGGMSVVSSIVRHQRARHQETDTRKLSPANRRQGSASDFDSLGMKPGVVCSFPPKGGEPCRSP